MAGESTIGALRVLLGLDTAKFEEGLKSSLGGLQSFGKQVAAIATGVHIERMFEQASAAIVESIKHAIDAGDELGKLAQKFGIPAEELSALSVVAGQSDLSIQDLGASFAKLSRSATEAQDGTSASAAAFKALGVSVRDSNGQLKDQQQLFFDVSTAISKYADGTGKAAVEQALFGRSGADLNDLLNKGAAGIKAAEDQFRRLGIVMSTEDVEAAKKFKDSLKLLEDQKDAIILKILGSSGMLDAMEKLSAALINAAGGSRQLSDNISGALKQAIDFLNNDLPKAVSALDQVARGLNRANEATTGWGTWLREKMIDALGATERETQKLEDAAVRAAAASQIQKQNLDALTDSLDDYLADLKAAESGKPLLFDPKAAANAKALADEMAKLKVQVLEASGVFGAQLAPGFLAAATNLEALKGQVTLTGAEIGKLGPQAQLLNDEMLKLQGLKFAEQAVPAWQQFQVQVELADQGLQKLGFTGEQIAAINENAAERAGVSWKNATSEILHNAASGFAAFAQKNKEFAGIAKGLAIAEATWNTYQAASKALATYPPPFGEIAAAAAVVAGLGMVAKISSTQFAKGGSFRIPGGINSTDSKMIPLALSSGEQVDITPSSQMRDRGGRGVQTIEIGVGMSDFLTGSNFRDLVDRLNQGARDGYKLRIAER